MQSLLNDIIVSNVFAFLLLFMRFGTALMIMPGIGDSFVSPQVRLLFALAFSFVLMPFLAPNLPQVPVNTAAFLVLILAEGIIGLFIGTVMRIMIAALDTTGYIISMQTGFANAMIFNPLTATQGSLVGALYSMLGVTLLMVSNMHHFLLAAAVESYKTFPVTGSVPDASDMLDVIRRAVSTAFLVGVQIAMPFLIVGILMQYGFGLLSRLMPQVQIFFIAQPLQIGLNLIMITMVLSVGIMYWLNNYAELVSKLLGF